MILGSAQRASRELLFAVLKFNYTGLCIVCNTNRLKDLVFYDFNCKCKRSILKCRVVQLCERTRFQAGAVIPTPIYLYHGVYHKNLSPLKGLGFATVWHCVSSLSVRTTKPLKSSNKKAPKHRCSRAFLLSEI